MKIYLLFSGYETLPEKVLYMENWLGDPFAIKPSKNTLFVHKGIKYEHVGTDVDLDNKTVTLSMYSL